MSYRLRPMPIDFLVLITPPSSDRASKQDLVARARHEAISSRAPSGTCYQPLCMRSVEHGHNVPGESTPGDQPTGHIMSQCEATEPARKACESHPLICNVKTDPFITFFAVRKDLRAALAPLPSENERARLRPPPPFRGCAPGPRPVFLSLPGQQLRTAKFAPHPEKPWRAWLNG